MSFSIYHSNASKNTKLDYVSQLSPSSLAIFSLGVRQQPSVLSFFFFLLACLQLLKQFEASVGLCGFVGIAVSAWILSCPLPAKAAELAVQSRHSTVGRGK